MQGVIESIVYLLAVMGIIMTIATVFEMFCCKNVCTYRLLNKNFLKNKRVEMIINLKDFDEDEQNELIEKIEHGMYENIEDIVDSIKIQKE